MVRDEARYLSNDCSRHGGALGGKTVKQKLYSFKEIFAFVCFLCGLVRALDLLPSI